MLMYDRAVKVKAFKNYLLLIEFANGSIKIYNCHFLLELKLYAELKDVTFFNAVQIDEMGVVYWDRVLDIHPDDLYENSIPVEEFHF